MLELIPEVAYGRALLARVLDRVRGSEDDRELGASAAEWVLITAITVTIVVAVGGILLAKWRTKASSIPTSTP
jgi:hypothetical protein